MSDERARWRLAGLAVLGLAVAVFVFGSNPANLPESWVERWLAKKLPIGSSIVAVRNSIDNEGWKLVEEGVSDGSSIVVVEVGRAWLTRKSVRARFEFDRFGRLVDIEVTSTSAASLHSRAPARTDPRPWPADPAWSAG